MLCAAVSALCVAAAGCSDPTSSAVSPVQPNLSVSATATLTGRIVYTLSGQLRVYNVATKADVSLGVSGVNPKFSPNGALIVYQSSGIRVMNSDGTNSRLLNATGGTPSFNPTSTMVAFGDNGIWQINVDGTGLTRLANAGLKPTWSPDGSQIAYHGSAGGVSQLFLMNADGTNQRQALTSAAIIDPVWLPSGRVVLGILVGKDYEIHSFDPITSALTRLTTRTGNDFEPSWSPDASGIAWASTYSRSAGIYIMNADGSGQQGPVIAKGRQGSWGP